MCNKLLYLTNFADISVVRTSKNLAHCLIELIFHFVMFWLKINWLRLISVESEVVGCCEIMKQHGTGVALL